MTVRAYIAGPIFGKPNGNQEAFQLMERDLATIGITPVNPWKLDKSHDGPCPIGPTGSEDVGTVHTILCHMLTDLKHLLTCDVVIFLSGWEYSSGSFVEFTTARATGKLMFFSWDQLLSWYSASNLAPWTDVS